MPPKVSVIIPVYNVAPFVRQCLDSVVGQTLEDVEIICVDDCGDDDSMEIVERYADNDDRIRIIRHEINKGLAEARNTGVAASEGEYVICVDSDDWITCDMLEVMYRAIKKHDLDSVWCKFAYYLDETGQYVMDRHYMPFCELSEQMIELDRREISSFIYPEISCNKLIRREVLRKYSVKWPKGLYNEDVPFYFKLYTVSHKVYLLDAYLYVYRQRTGSIMGQIRKNQAKLSLQR